MSVTKGDYMTPKTLEVQVCMSTNILNNYDQATFQELERRARTLGEAIANHYEVRPGQDVTVSVSNGVSGYGAGKNSEWFRVSYLAGKEKVVLLSKGGNFNDYCGMRRLWSKFENNQLESVLR